MKQDLLGQISREVLRTASLVKNKKDCKPLSFKIAMANELDIFKMTKLYKRDLITRSNGTRSKVSVNFGTRSNAFFGSRSKVLLIYSHFWQ
jgi:hypothetical protein